MSAAEGVGTDITTLHLPSIDRVVHGAGAIDALPDLVAAAGGTRVQLVTNRSVERAGLADRVEHLLDGLPFQRFVGIRAHAPVADIEAATEAADGFGADLLVGLGGSSVTDATKVVALRLGERHGGRIPQILVPTTLSAGEYSAGSGVTGRTPGVKDYVIDPSMAPWAVILDPTTTLTTPARLWSTTGFKALDHACETMWSGRGHPLALPLAREALGTLPGALRACAADPHEVEARLSCQLAAWMSAFALAHGGVHLSHVLGHEMGARWGISHGATSSIALPHVARLMAEQRPAAAARVGRALAVDEAADDRAVALAGAEVLRQLAAELQLPDRLRETGADRNDFDDIAAHVISTLRFFNDTIDGGVDAVVALLERMW